MTGATEPLRVDAARPADGPEVAALIRGSKAAAMPWLPVVHRPDEDLVWVTTVLLVEDEVVVVRERGAITAVLATRPGWVEHLYVLPTRQGVGIGRALLDRAMARSDGRLQLWAFTRNTRARRFYERAGFQVVEETDGAANEEHEPDVRYRWIRPDRGGWPPPTGTVPEGGPRLSHVCPEGVMTKVGDGPDDPARRTRGLSRRAVLGVGAVAGAAGAVGPSAPAGLPGPGAVGDPRSDLADPGGTGPGAVVDAVDPGDLAQESSTFFATAFVEYAGTNPATGSDGDLWPSCWADDDNVYAANGDGRGFSDEPFADVVVNRILGHPETGVFGARLAAGSAVARVWADPADYNRKPTGMVCVGGVLYLAVQDLRHSDPPFDDAPNASISRSDDHGVTWTTTTEAMFTDHRFTTVFFADFGRDSENAVPALGARDGAYVYAYGLDWNWRASTAGVVPDPVDLYLARVPAAAVQDRGQWTFFTGLDPTGKPVWNRRIEKKVPVLHDPLRRYVDPQHGLSGSQTVISQGGVLYDRPLRRYLYTSWTGPSFEFYEAPEPWGPWRRFLHHNTGLSPWYRADDPDHNPKNGGYATTLPSKYVSADGCDLWLQSNWWQAPAPSPDDNYNFNLRRVHLAPHRPSAAVATGRAVDLARTGAGVTVALGAARTANWHRLNDGDRSTGEDSFDGTNKTIDHWGYTFTRTYLFGRIEYTTGTMPATGGWFSAYAGGLRVQVRREFRWVDVHGLTVSPDYPYDRNAGPHRTFTLRFTPLAGDGIRIIGQPGGSGHFTSVAELEVYSG